MTFVLTCVTLFWAVNYALVLNNNNTKYEDAMLNDSLNEGMIFNDSRNEDVILKDSGYKNLRLNDSRNEYKDVMLNDSRNEYKDVMLNDSRNEYNVMLNDSRNEYNVVLNGSRNEYNVMLNDSRNEYNVMLNDTRNEYNVMLNDSRNKDNVMLNISKSEDTRGLTWDELMDVLKSETNFRLGRFNLTTISLAVNISRECRESLRKFVTSLSDWETWAVRMADASGGIPSGILGGRWASFGSFDQCLSVRSPAHFRGQYCMMGMQSPLLTKLYDKKGYAHRNEEYEKTYGKPPEWVTDFLARSGPRLKYLSFYLGTCVPSACSRGDMAAIYAHVSKPLGFEVTKVDCQVEEPIIWVTQDIVAMSFLALIAILCLLGTATDIVGRYVCGDQQYKDCPLAEWLAVFSVRANWARAVSRPPSGSLACLDGLRVLSFLWILVHHTTNCYSDVMLSLYRNLLDLTDGWTGYLRAVFLDAAFTANDTFFCISGFLLVFTTWKKLENSSGKFNILKFMLQKYFRIAPSLALAISVFLLAAKSGSGPFWGIRVGPMYETCRATWWKNFLFINNWRPSGTGACVDHTWFLDCLMQLHLIGIILLCIVYRWPIKGTALSAFLLVGAIAYTSAMMIGKDFPMPRVYYVKDSDFTHAAAPEFLFKTSVHISSYMAGMAFGYAYLKRKKHLHTASRVSLWLFAACSAFYVVYGAWCFPESRASRFFYYVSILPLRAMCLGWLIYACCSGQGGVVNSLLSWTGFTFLSKLSYVMYLLHMTVIIWAQTSTREAVTYGGLNTVLEILGYFSASIIISVIAYVTVELPFGTITTKMFKSK